MIKENSNRIISGVLAIAVIVLFILHFSGKDKEVIENQSAQPGTLVGNMSEIKVAYVFVDSVLANYEYYKILTDKLLAKKSTLEKELSSKGESFQKEVTDFQYKVGKKLITSWDAEARQKQLTEQQQVLVNLQNDMQNKLAQDEQSVTIQLHDSVINAVNEVNRKLGYNLVLSNTFGGGLLYADDYMNITKQVLDRLNEFYRKTSAK
ncbi:MAG: OmpH family outer membrane protein [Porphyromonadaceae bacterium]|nr:MAG: OmpH family outer membrane protein [Porphyromonadaceae bacterium]